MDNTSTISEKELDLLLRKMGMILRVDQVEAMLAKYDADGNGEIDFTEFLSLMVDLKKLRRQQKINPNTKTVKELRDMGFNADEVKACGFSPQLMRQEDWPVSEMVKAFKPLDLRHAGYTVHELRHGGLGPASLKRIGYSSVDLRNAGFSRASIGSMNQHLYQRPDTVPHFDFKKLASAPQQNGHMTPRIRHFADDQVKVSTGNRNSRFQAAKKKIDAVKRMSKLSLLKGKPAGRLSGLQTELGLVKDVQAVSVPTGSQRRPLTAAALAAAAS